ncbi:hypothetical protein [Coleofasciculus sp. E1-EBD-02]
MARSDEAGGQYMGVNLSHITHDRILGVGMGCGVWGVGESEQFWGAMY